MSSESNESIVIVHISDLHIEKADSAALHRIRQLAGAIGSLRDRTSKVLILVGGDVAYSGQASEYELALDAISDLESILKEEWKFDEVRTYACPGNHDCDFKAITPGVQEALLSGLSGDSGKQLQIIDSLSLQQKQFSDFSDAISPPIQKINTIVSIVNIQCGSSAINLLLINTSWSSRIKEKAGSLRMPAEALPRINLTDDLSLALLHHPLNWYVPQDGKALSDWLDAHADVAFWGHEHRSDDFMVSRRRFGSSVQHYLGLPIQDDTDQCGFRCIVVDGVETFDSIVFEWRGGRYIPSSVVNGMRPTNPARSLGQVRFTNNFKSFLLDVGATFKHIRIDRPIVLSDVFVSPEFKGFEVDKTQSEKIDGTVSAQYIADKIYKKSMLVAYGPEQAGKTTFAKYVIEDARHRGITSIYLDASRLKSSNKGDITAWINSALSNQYESDCISLIKQIERSKKLVIIDNIHQVSGGSTAVKNIVERIEAMAAHSLLLTSQNPAITILASNYTSADDLKIWNDADWHELLPLNNNRRGELIRRWAALAGC